MRVVLSLSFIVLFFSGCSPKYVIENHYIPSQDSGFVPCVKVCDKIRQSCEYDFQVDQKTCKDVAYGRAKIAHDEALLKYERVYRSYLHDVTLFETDSRIWNDRKVFLEKDFFYFDKNCKKDADKYACKRVKEIKSDMRFHESKKPKRPYAPRKPLFKRYLDTELLMCKKASPCEGEYDKCYISCGGEIVPQKICVSNCD